MVVDHSREQKEWFPTTKCPIWTHCKVCTRGFLERRRRECRMFESNGRQGLLWSGWFRNRTIWLGSSRQAASCRAWCRGAGLTGSGNGRPRWRLSGRYGVPRPGTKHAAVSWISTSRRPWHAPLPCKSRGSSPNAVKPNDVGVAHHRQKANFCLHSRVLSKVKLFLVNYFDCDFLLRQLVDSKHDLAKCTFADFIL